MKNHRIIDFEKNRDIIYCYERPASIEILISLGVGILEGDMLPILEFYTFNKGKSFEVPYVQSQVEGNEKKGGNHRTIINFLLKPQSEVRIIDSSEYPWIQPIPESIKFPILGMGVEHQPEEFNYRKDSNYRELPSVEDFFGKYSEINKALGTKLSPDYFLDEKDYEEILEGVRRG